MAVDHWRRIGDLCPSHPHAVCLEGRGAAITETFINCPRYITKHASSEPAPHVSDANGEVPLAEWKKIDLLQDVLPKRFQNLADNAGGTITIDECNEKVLRGET
jgi:uncharacterized protein